jgi:hypothetical protein
MMENFALMELARQLTWSQERCRLYHFRTKDKLEVDAVIETPDGRVIGIGVKAGATVRTEDLAAPAPGESGRRQVGGRLCSIHWSEDTAVRREAPGYAPRRPMASSELRTLAADPLLSHCVTPWGDCTFWVERDG